MIPTELTPEQFNQLLEYEVHFKTAINSNYAHLPRTAFSRIIEIFYQMPADKAIAKSAFNCSYCRLKELKKIGKMFLEYKNKK